MREILTYFVFLSIDRLIYDILQHKVSENCRIQRGNFHYYLRKYVLFFKIIIYNDSV